MRQRSRHTKITFTLGPASAKPEVIEQILLCGGDVCRLNMAHADHDTVRRNVGMIREASKRTGREVAIMMDIKGPEIRTAARKEALDLKIGDTLDMGVDPNCKEEDGIALAVVNYPLLVRDVPHGGLVLVDNGLIQLRVVEKRADRLRCRVEQPGKLGPTRRHVNLPGVKVELPALTEKDLGDVAVGVEVGIDFVALSFCREAADVEALRDVLTKLGSKAGIISKIEDQSAIANLDGIIKASDALMVARGDLGIEVPYETLPLIQKRAVETCIRHHKPVIVATHMLESMIENPVPTRAEVTDVANAVFERTDSVMLSGETAQGKHPLKCLEVMTKISEKVESSRPAGINADVIIDEPKHKMMKAAAQLALDVGNSAIIAFTRNGAKLRLLASLRPDGVPLFAFTDDITLARQLRLVWGAEPFVMKFSMDPEQNVQEAIRQLRVGGWVHRHDNLVIATNVIVGDRVVDSLQLRQVQ